MGKNLKEERLGATRYNKQGCLMKVVEYNSNNDIIVEFEDGTQVKTSWQRFIGQHLTNPNRFSDRLGMEKICTQGYLMKIVEYNNPNDIIVEFQDQYKGRVKTGWHHFVKGLVRNPYHPNQYGGMSGNKYITAINQKSIKEYNVWKGMLQRCFDIKTKIKHPAYKDVTCCKEWLLFENFYEWLHSQENFEVWKNTDGFSLDKDILIKGNKIYGPDTCCLVPQYINLLFEGTSNFSTKEARQLPLGIYYWEERNKYIARYNKKSLGYYKSSEEAFGVYKKHKEAHIKQVAQEEYEKGTISKKCYEAMMKWEVEITD